LIIVSLDNADQRDFQTQQSTFIIAQEIAKDWQTSVFVSVRPQTFFTSKQSGALTAYPPKVFTISPPRIDDVVEKRLRFALKIAEGSMPIETMNFLRVNSENLAQFIKALLYSLAENNDLFEFLTNITGGNIRAAVEFVTNFIGSPNVDADKIIDIMTREGNYRIPLHEFTKSALLGDYSHYNPETSIAMNVYDVSYPDNKEHFLVPLLIAFLGSTHAKKDSDGFCATEALFIELQNNGFTKDQMEIALRRSVNKKLIETSQRITFAEDQNGLLIGEMPSSFRITSIGMYHIKRWISSFTYFDAMAFDTPIFDKQVREEITHEINSFVIASRYERAIAFRDYLARCWENLPIKPTYYNFIESIDDGASTFESVRRNIERAAT